MSCTNSLYNKSYDIEDLLLDHQKYELKGIEKNIKKYEQIIYKIIDWYYQHQHDYDIYKKFHFFYTKFTREARIFCKKNLLVYIYRKLIEQKKVDNIPFIWTLLQKRRTRNLSGVTIITVLTSPYPDKQRFSCKHNCYYCPNEPGQPRSYLKKEPAVARANDHNFDAYRQMKCRLDTLLMNGHEIDKLEIIIEGGTYTEYPPKYLQQFHRDLIYCANTYFDKHKREKYSIQEEIKINATSKVRIIGICIETRPDSIDDIWLKRFRYWGVTRVQLGVQHTNNEVLKKVNRGHTIEQASKAIQYLKDNCFKVDIHLMPDLPNSSPEKDIDMFNYVYNTSNLQPDQIKIYPCQVTPWTVIKQWYKRGLYKPYAETKPKEFMEVMKYGLTKCPPWIRLPRVVRDIPLCYVEGGLDKPNLRQLVTDEMEKNGQLIQDIRYRECGRNLKYSIDEAEFIHREYRATNGTEYFISLESKDRKCLFGFIRLRIPDNYNNTIFKSLFNKGLIRELHVYGNVMHTSIKSNKNILNNIQHKGVGKKLVKYAEDIAKKNKCNGTVVISGIGVTEYYKKLGYHMQETYMIKTFSNNNFIVYLMLLSICFIILHNLLL